jgi:hypothetical protein
MRGYYYETTSSFHQTSGGMTLPPAPANCKRLVERPPPLAPAAAAAARVHLLAMPIEFGISLCAMMG